MLADSTMPSGQTAPRRIHIYMWCYHRGWDCSTIDSLTIVNEKEAAYCPQFLRGCPVLGYLTAVVRALCLNVDKKQAAENLGCECEPPVSLVPAELHKTCGCTSNAGSHPRFAAG